MRIRATVTAVVLTLVAGTAAHAQAGQNPVEIGIDAQMSVGLSDQGTRISIPAQKVRAGFVIAEAMTFEPSLGFERLSANGASVSTLALDLSLLYHFSTSRAARQLYVRPVFGLERLASSGSAGGSSISFLALGVAGGMKVPLRDRFGARVEAEFRNRMEKEGIPSARALNLNFGLSYFTR